MKRILIIAVFALALAGCKKTGVITTESSTLEFGHEGGTLSLTFDVTAAWSATLSESAALWCSIDNTGGPAGTHTINVTATANEGDVQRYGTITVTSGSLQKAFTLTQAFYIPAMHILIEHSRLDFQALLFSGEHLSGSVSWGDGESGDYSESHSYASEGTKTVEYDMQGVDDFTLESLESVTKIIIRR